MGSNTLVTEFIRLCVGWLKDDRPKRDSNRRKELYTKFCKDCEHHQELDRKGKGWCSLSGMIVASVGQMNKLAFADQSCPINKFKAEPTSSACIYRGVPTGEVRLCELCGSGGVKLKVFECSLHGTCTIRRWSTSLDNSEKVCQTCNDKKIPDG